MKIILRCYTQIHLRKKPQEECSVDIQPFLRLNSFSSVKVCNILSYFVFCNKSKRQGRPPYTRIDFEIDNLRIYIVNVKGKVFMYDCLTRTVRNRFRQPCCFYSNHYISIQQPY